VNLPSQVAAGIGYLLDHQNPDGGIPATAPSQSSGSWTTASTLEALVSSRHCPQDRYDQLREMVRYLIDSRIADGGWPMAKASSHASAMATGHAIAAVVRARYLYPRDSSVLLSLDTAVQQATEWLLQHQNPEGGWGIEPTTTDGNASRLISTVYALRSLLAQGQTSKSSQAVQRATSYLITLFNDDGGCGSGLHAKSDVCSTSRALYVLIESGAQARSAPLIKKALSFITRHGDRWVVLTEKYVSRTASGMITYHGNTPYDVLMALLSAGGHRSHVQQLVRSYLSAQNTADGSWILSDERTVDTSISTWSTAEAVSALDRAWEVFGQDCIGKLGWRTVAVRVLVVFVVAVVLAVGAILLGVPAWVKGWWTQQSEFVKTVIITGVLVGVAATLIGEILLEFIRKGGRWMLHWLQGVLNN
jgi:hypothetical protein